MIRRPPRSTLFPSPPLFRSEAGGDVAPARPPHHRDVARPGFGGLLARSEEHTSELQSHLNLVCRLLLEKKNTKIGGVNLSNFIVTRCANITGLTHDIADAVV